MKKTATNYSNLKRYSAALALLYFLFAFTSFRAAAQGFSDKLDSYLNTHLAQGVYSGTVVVTLQAKVVYTKGFGMADYEQQVANGPETKFRFGSITKAFTAVLVLQLQEQGKLNVQDKVSKYLPDFPNGDKITLHHLLTHTSGLANYTDTWQDVNTQPTTGAALVNYFKDKSLAFEPGAKFSYCNSGYVLLGYIIEKVSGKTYEQMLARNILKPLKMKTAGLEASKPVAGLAIGYNHSGVNRKLAKPINMSWCWAAGGLYGTAADLARFDEGLRGNKLLSDASKKMLYTPEKQNYAYGCVVDSLFNEKRISYSGAINGFKASFVRFPEKQITIAVLSNYESQQVNGPITKDVTAIVMGEKCTVPTVHKLITLAPAQMAAYVGDYQVAPKVLFKILLEDGQLYAEGPDKERFEIFPEAEDRFFIKVAPALINFEKDEAGKVAKMVLVHNGRAMPATRVN